MTHKSVALTEKIHRYEMNNLACARIILADQGRYGGDQSLMVIWAWAVIRKYQ